MARDRQRDRGYALVAAVTAVAAFAYIAFQVLAAGRGQIAGVGARVEQAKLQAAADAGMMIAIHALGDPDPSRHGPLDGTFRRGDFDGTALAIAVQDERGKVPLDGVNATQSRALFENAGASGPRVDDLVAELTDFQFGDQDSDSDIPAPPVPPSPYGQVRHGGFRTVGDLMALKDMDAALFARIAPAVTVFFEESGPFQPNNAGELARTTMTAEEEATPDLFAQENAAAEQSGDEPPPPEDLDLIGRTLTVSVVAADRRGARAHRTAIVELTGDSRQPYWVRYQE